MLTIKMRFPAGRFHATPWDRQVNEGVVEWPPSPWRLLRALISTWYHKANRDIDEAVIRRLVEKLSRFPEYGLPPATAGHTRHYMPLYRSPLDGKTTKVFDTFLSIKGGDCLHVVWRDVDLDDEERRSLDVLLSRMGYLGRAESLVDACIADGMSVSTNSRPLGEGDALPEGHEGVRTLSCTSAQRYPEWRQRKLDEHTARRLEVLRSRAAEKGKPVDSIKLSSKDNEGLESGLPRDIFEALHAETSELKRAGWSQPPGSAWVTYTRPANAFDVRPRSGSVVQPGDGGLPTVARFAVASQVPPRLTSAVLLAERIHTALASRSGGSSTLTGLDGTSGEPLDGHRHAHIFCESNVGLGRGRRGEVTHVTLYAPMGLGPVERRAVDGLTRVWGREGHDVQLVLLGVGRLEDFGGNDVSKGQCPLLSESRTWVSRTPFVPTRHPKSTRGGRPKVDAEGLQIGSPEHELHRLLELAGFPRPSSIEPMQSTNLGGHETRWLQFVRERRSGGGRRAGNMGYGFRITFAEPVTGPLALGYGAHFGLGLFVPADDRSRDK